MSPEQAHGVGDDPRSDLYATALVIYYCLAGKPLYESGTGYELLRQGRRRAGAQGMGGRRLAFRHRFSAVLRRALAPKVEHRYQTAREMADDLESSIGDGAATDPRVDRSPVRLRSWPPKRAGWRTRQTEPAQRERMPT